MPLEVLDGFFKLVLPKVICDSQGVVTPGDADERFLAKLFVLAVFDDVQEVVAGSRVLLLLEEADAQIVMSFDIERIVAMLFEEPFPSWCGFRKTAGVLQLFGTGEQLRSLW